MNFPFLLSLSLLWIPLTMYNKSLVTATQQQTTPVLGVPTNNLVQTRPRWTWRCIVRHMSYVSAYFQQYIYFASWIVACCDPEEKWSVAAVTKPEVGVAQQFVPETWYLEHNGCLFWESEWAWAGLRSAAKTACYAYDWTIGHARAEHPSRCSQL